MKKILLTLGIAIASYCSYAQTNTFPSSGNVGIGTTTPDYARKMTISGTENNTAILFNDVTDASNFYLGVFNAYGNGNFAIDEQGVANRFTIQKSTGNIGIGTANPSGALQIQKTAPGTIGPILSLVNGAGVAAGNATQISFAGNPGGSATAPTAYIRATDNSVAGATFSFGTYDGANLTDKMTILPAGNVGIGTSSPTSLLSVGSTSQFQVNSTGQVSSAVNNPFVGTYNGTGFSVNTVQNGTTGFWAGVEGSNPGVLANGTTAYSAYLGTPSNKPLEFGTNTYVRMSIDGDGKVGIGTTSPSNKFTIQGDANSTGAADGVAQLLIRGNTSIYKRLAIGMDTYNNVGFIKSDNYGTAPYPLSLQPDGGNILIGKTTQTNTTYKLDINGSARANEVVVNTTGADFVFDSDYNLPELSEVKEYIDKNHHLPEIPSAAEMQKNGMGVGELNTKLLQKVEELTLYLIAKDKQVTEQSKLLTDQQKINQSLQAQINQLIIKK